jgi:glycine dehydrogenase
MLRLLQINGIINMKEKRAAYPSEILKTTKYWPPVARVDNVYGDKNLFCTCPSIDEYKDTAA